MDLLHTLGKSNVIPGGCVATVGNFDGVHRGHRAVLAQLQHHARELGLPSVVLIFEPQPLEYFQPESAPTRLSNFREKFSLLAGEGIDKLVCLRFQASLAAVSAEEFVQRLFVEAMGIRRIIIGDDFRFGQNREGDIQTLRRMGRQAGFDVIPVDSFSMKGERVSSSLVRQALSEHDFRKAASLLGRPYRICGRIRHGDKRGRQLGFPTANIALNRNRPPLHGVYAVYVRGLGETRYEGVANIGTRPVFDGEQLLLEVHILDYSDDIYGQHVEVEFLQYLRGEQKFASVDELRSQIARDINDAKALFASGKDK